MHNQEWLTVSESVTLIGKSERTIRRFMANEPSYHKKIDGISYLNKVALIRHFTGNIADKMSNETEKVKHQKEAVQVAANAKSIDSMHEQLIAKDRQIKEILAEKRNPKSTIWITLAFMALLICLYMGFLRYRNELLSYQRERINEMSQAYEYKILSKSEQIEEIKKFNQVTLNSKESIITQQRQELAEKDRLISELYNDTKAQNKKLLELTESLQTESSKMAPIENNSGKNEPQKD